jgi:TPR repeat protein
MAKTRFHLIAAILMLALGQVATGPAAADYAAALEAYDNGRIDEAVREWQRLADAGEPASQVALADMILANHLPGAGLPEVIELYRRAAAAGDPIAQLNLGDYYSRGYGLPRDRVKAYAWLSLAAAQGRQWAEDRRRELAEEMSEGERAEARALADTLAP